MHIRTYSYYYEVVLTHDSPWPMKQLGTLRRNLMTMTLHGVNPVTVNVTPEDWYIFGQSEVYLQCTFALTATTTRWY